MLECTNGSIPDDAQGGLRPVFKKNNYFLPCVCRPEEDLEICEIDHDKLYQTAYVYKKELLSEGVCRLFIESDNFMNYHGGQFINLSRPEDGVVRSYSVANNPENDYYIELHIQRMLGGELSRWIFDDLNELDEIEIQGPNGHCVYQSGSSRFPILMVATHTGLAPLAGVLKEALLNEHKSDIHLYHECRSAGELYLDVFLKDLAEKHTNFYYHPGVTAKESVIGDVSFSKINLNHEELSDWMVYLAGSNEMILHMLDLVSEKGASDKKIFTDAFDLKDLRGKSVNSESSLKRRVTDDVKPSAKVKEADYPEPDLEIWQALGNGKKLNKILDDFYTIVYEDERLSPFFSGITKQRSIEKVYLFLRQIFTGEKVYIGDRPRNAHHWMVISDDLFDYREDIMAECLRNNGISEDIIGRWQSIEESYRPDIVKEKAWNKIVNGIELPVEGYEEMTLDCGAMCDSCQQPIDSGSKVRYHVRLGEVYCSACMSSD